MVAEEQVRRDEELVVRRGTRRGQDLEGRSRSRAFFSIRLQLGGDQGRVTRQETLTGAWFCLADGQGSCGVGRAASVRDHGSLARIHWGHDLKDREEVTAGAGRRELADRRGWSESQMPEG